MCVVFSCCHSHQFHALACRRIRISNQQLPNEFELLLKDSNICCYCKFRLNAFWTILKLTLISSLAWCKLIMVGCRSLAPDIILSKYYCRRSFIFLSEKIVMNFGFGWQFNVSAIYIYILLPIFWIMIASDWQWQMFIRGYWSRARAVPLLQACKAWNILH